MTTTKTAAGRRTRLVVLLSALALVAAACSGGSEGDGASGGEPIKLGAAVGLTGPSAGNIVQIAVERAARLVNDKGGVDGRMLEVTVEDTNITAAQGLAAARKLVNDKVVAVVGIGATTQNLAVSPVFQQAKIINLLGTASTANNFEKTGNPYNFVFNIPDDATARHQVSFATETLEAERIALLLDSSAFGKGFGTLVTPLITAAGATVSATEYVNPDANSLSTQVSKLLASDPDVIMAALLTSPTVSLTYSELRKQGGSDPPKMMVAASVVANLGKGVPWAEAQGTYGTYMTKGMYDPAARNPDDADWFAALAEGNVPVSDNAAEMYDAVLAYVAAVDSTGGTDPDKISAYLSTLEDFSGWNGIKTISGPYTCDSSHQCLHAQFMGQVKGEALSEVRHYTD
jgi:branched-chain amino acid transport system substrate-binding protein